METLEIKRTFSSFGAKQCQALLRLLKNITGGACLSYTTTKLTKSRQVIRVKGDIGENITFSFDGIFKTLNIFIKDKEVISKLPKRFLPKPTKYALIMVDYEYLESGEFNTLHKIGGEREYTKSKSKAMRVRLEDVESFKKRMTEVWGVNAKFIDVEETTHKGRGKVFSEEGILIVR